MAKLLVADILDRQILRLNALATVMDDCVVIRDRAHHSHIILGLSHLTALRRNRTSRPAFLVIASGLVLIAAASYASRNANAGMIVGALSSVSVLAYFLSRRESVTFVAGRYSAETESGTLAQAASLIATVRRARELHAGASEPEIVPEPLLESRAFAEAA